MSHGVTGRGVSMEETELPPDPNLMESMRAVGYTMETAIADIIDNSVTANADLVEILFRAGPTPHVAILDNGIGMDRARLIDAMQLAGHNPRTTRSEHDLGRFGLGLKTASLSQARILTVVSKHGGAVRGVRWSLDHLAATGRWSLQILGEQDLCNVPRVDDLARLPSGTLVVWTDLDQLRAQAGDLESLLDERIAHARDHLALVFHRFINNTTPPLKKPLSIRINGAALKSLDPFLASHRGTQAGPVEDFKIRGTAVRVQAYTLPYLKNLTAKDRETALISGALRDNQGFYIYRAARLVLWGTWFRLMPKNDMSKLARVRVDIPNSLDDLWSLDIKKSSAIPPAEIRQLLRRLADKIVQPSHRVQRFRGRALESVDQIQRLWLVVEERGSFRYEIDPSHPLVASLDASLNPEARQEFREVLHVLESTFPVEDAYNRLSEDAPHEPGDINVGELADLARTLHANMRVDLSTLAQRLALVEPFTQIPNLEAFLREITGE